MWKDFFEFYGSWGVALMFLGAFIIGVVAFELDWPVWVAMLAGGLFGYGCNVWFSNFRK